MGMNGESQMFSQNYRLATFINQLSNLEARLLLNGTYGERILSEQCFRANHKTRSRWQHLYNTSRAAPLELLVEHCGGDSNWRNAQIEDLEKRCKNYLNAVELIGTFLNFIHGSHEICAIFEELPMPHTYNLLCAEMIGDEIWDHASRCMRCGIAIEGIITAIAKTPNDGLGLGLHDYTAGTAAETLQYCIMLRRMSSDEVRWLFMFSEFADDQKLWQSHAKDCRYCTWDVLEKRLRADPNRHQLCLPLTKT